MPRGDELVRALQGRLDATIIEPAPNDIDKADAALVKAAQAFYAAVVNRRSYMPPTPDYWSALEPGAVLADRLARFEAAARMILSELGQIKHHADPVPPPGEAPDETSDDEPFEWPDGAPAPGSHVVDTRLRIQWRVIRSRLVAPTDFGSNEWRSLCERLTGEQAGEQEWIKACELEPRESL